MMEADADNRHRLFLFSRGNNVLTNTLVLTERLQKTANEIGTLLTAELIAELSEQGHRATGKLIDSVRYEFAPLPDGLEIIFYHLDYGTKLNTGLLPHQIKISVSEHQDLTEWVEFRRMAMGGAARAIAWRIMAKWKREGFPTRRSVAFSKNGRRTGWIDNTVKAQRAKIHDIASEGFDLAIREEVNSMVNKWRRHFTKAA